MPTRVMISTGDALSLKAISQDIGRVFAKHGIAPIVTTQFMPNFVMSHSVDAVLFFYPADPAFSASYVGYYATYKSFLKERMQFYTTIEGVPHHSVVNKPMFYYVDFIANSQYTKNKLEEAGLKVKEIIPHGIILEDIELAERLGKDLRKTEEEKLGDKVLFGYLGTAHVRKNLQMLIDAVKILNQKGRKDFAVLLLTEPKKVDLQDTENIFLVGDIRTKNRIQVLSFLASVDFVISPTRSEGFGMPILEGMALGKICLHGNFPPLNEFSTTNNYMWDAPFYELLDETGKTGSGGLIYEMWSFSPEDIAFQMERAIDLKKENPKEYETRCMLNKKHAMKYNAYDLYSRFIKIMGL